MAVKASETRVRDCFEGFGEGGKEVRPASFTCKKRNTANE